MKQDVKGQNCKDFKVKTFCCKDIAIQFNSLVVLCHLELLTNAETAKTSDVISLSNSLRLLVTA